MSEPKDFITIDDNFTFRRQDFWSLSIQRIDDRTENQKKADAEKGITPARHPLYMSLFIMQPSMQLFKMNFQKNDSEIALIELYLKVLQEVTGRNESQMPEFEDLAEELDVQGGN